MISAIGQAPDVAFAAQTGSPLSGLKTTRWSTIVTKGGVLMTDCAGVFAGGDIVAGAATVILAMGHGRKAAAAIDKYVRDEAKEQG